MNVVQMINNHPDVQGSMNETLVQCIEDCYDCAQANTSCADACLAEDNVNEMKQCIRLNLDCADVCMATGKLAARRTGSDEQLLLQMLQICEAACRICAEECEKHAGRQEHCRICAEICRHCEQSCRQTASTINPD